MVVLKMMPKENNEQRSRSLGTVECLVSAVTRNHDETKREE